MSSIKELADELDLLTKKFEEKSYKLEKNIKTLSKTIEILKIDIQKLENIPIVQGIVIEEAEQKEEVVQKVMPKKEVVQKVMPKKEVVQKEVIEEAEQKVMPKEQVVKKEKIGPVVYCKGHKKNGNPCKNHSRWFLKENNGYCHYHAYQHDPSL